MYRAYCYYNPKTPNAPETAIALRSEKYDTPEKANAALESLLAITGMTGGGIEQHVPGIGWVLADEVETTVYLHRLHQSDRETDVVDALAAVNDRE